MSDETTGTGGDEGRTAGASSTAGSGGDAGSTANTPSRAGAGGTTSASSTAGAGTPTGAGMDTGSTAGSGSRGGTERTSAGSPASAGRRPRVSEAFGGNRGIVDAAGPPIAFVVGVRLLDLEAAAAMALALAAVLVVLRVVRGHQWRYAVGGFAGVGIAVGFALWTGTGEGYFAPSMVLNALYAAGAVISILARRPLTAWVAVLIMRLPAAWCWHPKVRPAYSEITWAWAALFALRAGLRYMLIARGELELLATVHVVLGFPAFAVMTLLTFWYLQWRLPRLGGPDPRTFEAARRVV